MEEQVVYCRDCEYCEFINFIGEYYCNKYLVEIEDITRDYCELEYTEY